ncbi:hypothetical protein B0H13DRAFT_2375874 [Mycena leptocephala]|nr:hypothetical protein B0H13DRAFT_2375874 [Mycena leptocephala]
MPSALHLVSNGRSAGPAHTLGEPGPSISVSGILSRSHPKESALKIVHVTPPPKSPAPAFTNALAVELGGLHIKMAELHAQASTFEPRAIGTPSLASMQLSPASAVAAKLGYGMTCLRQINNAALNLGKYAPLEQARAQ